MKRRGDGPGDASLRLWALGCDRRQRRRPVCDLWLPKTRHGSWRLEHRAGDRCRLRDDGCPLVALHSPHWLNQLENGSPSPAPTELLAFEIEVHSLTAEGQHTEDAVDCGWVSVGHPIERPRWQAVPHVHPKRDLPQVQPFQACDAGRIVHRLVRPLHGAPARTAGIRDLNSTRSRLPVSTSSRSCCPAMVIRTVRNGLQAEGRRSSRPTGEKVSMRV